MGTDSTHTERLTYLKEAQVDMWEVRQREALHDEVGAGADDGAHAAQDGSEAAAVGSRQAAEAIMPVNNSTLALHDNVIKMNYTQSASSRAMARSAATYDQPY
jgi:hypothetical protein